MNTHVQTSKLLLWFNRKDWGSEFLAGRIGVPSFNRKDWGSEVLAGRTRVLGFGPFTF